MRAHEELCDMLGIPHETRPRRSRSVNAVTRDDHELLSASPLASRPNSNVGTSRPTSLPGTNGLSEVYNVMTADVSVSLL
jgi:hypothetical protein